MLLLVVCREGSAWSVRDERDVTVRHVADTHTWHGRWRNVAGSLPPDTAWHWGLWSRGARAAGGHDVTARACADDAGGGRWRDGREDTRRRGRHWGKVDETVARAGGETANCRGNKKHPKNTRMSIYRSKCKSNTHWLKSSTTGSLWLVQNRSVPDLTNLVFRNHSVLLNDTNLTSVTRLYSMLLVRVRKLSNVGRRSMTRWRHYAHRYSRRVTRCQTRVMTRCPRHRYNKTSTRHNYSQYRWELPIVSCETNSVFLYIKQTAIWGDDFENYIFLLGYYRFNCMQFLVSLFCVTLFDAMSYQVWRHLCSLFPRLRTSVRSWPRYRRVPRSCSADFRPDRPRPGYRKNCSQPRTKSNSEWNEHVTFNSHGYYCLWRHSDVTMWSAIVLSLNNCSTNGSV